MLRKTVCYINRPGVTLMRGVKALSKVEDIGKEEERGGAEKGTDVKEKGKK